MSVDNVDTAVQPPDVPATDSGAAEGAVDSGLNDGLVAAVADDIGVPTDVAKNILETDPDYAEMLKAKAGAGKGGEGPATDTSAADSAAGSEPKDAPDASAEGKDSGGKGDGAPLEFADGVIEGLTGAEFGKLSEDAQVALSAFYDEKQKATKAVSEYEARIAALMNDPVVAARAAAIESGVPAPQVRGLTAEDKRGIAKAVQERLSLDEEEAASLVSAFESGIESVAKSMAQDLASQTVASQDAVRREAEVNRQANELVLGLGSYNKELAVQETDLSKFYVFDAKGNLVYNAGHPEIEKYKNGLGRVVEWAGRVGVDNKKLVALGGKAFYAAAAAALDMPVALNVGERDKKIAADARRKALAPFLKGVTGGTLNTSGSAGVVNREEAERVVRKGMDVKRLVTDPLYYDEMLSKKPGNMDWLAEVDECAAEGRKLLEKKR